MFQTDMEHNCIMAKERGEKNMKKNGKIEEQDKNPDIVPGLERLPPIWEDIYSK